MEFAILGPLEVRAGRRLIDIPAAKHRVLLAALLLRANHVVPVDELADRLWGSDQPLSAKATLQGYVLRLRRCLTAAGAADRIVTKPPGYLIEVRPNELDLDRFRDLVSEADHAADIGELDEAADLLRAASALWRGPALADVPSESLRASAGPWLAELRRNAVEHRIDIDLRRGQHAELLGELTALVADEPLHERFRAQLMLALYRSGRSKDALKVYRDARATFVAELGLEPGERLRDLERAVLTNDPDLDWHPEVVSPARQVRPRALPPDIPDLVGREDLVRRLLPRLVEPSQRPGNPVVQVIAGMAGVGKTALAVHLGHLLRDSFPDGQLHATLQDVGGPVHPAEVLGRLLRLLGILGTHLPDNVEARSTLFRDRVAGRRVLLVLDDAVDEAQVRPLLPGDEGCTVLITSRNRLTGLTGADTVDLRVLDDQEALRLLGTVVGPGRVVAETGASTDLVHQCGGLPLAVRIAGARLAARANRPVRWLVNQLDDEHRRLDGLAAGDLQVRASLASSYRALDDEQRRAFRLLGLLNTGEYTPSLAAAILDRESHRAERLVEDLVDAQLLDFTGVADRYRSHALVRLYAREQAHATDCEADRRAAVHRALTAWLAMTEEADSLLPNAGWRPGSHEQHGADSMDWFDSERRELGVAIDQAVAEGYPELAWRLAAASSGYLELRGYWDEWRHTHERALVAAVAVGDAWGEARMRYGLSMLCFAKDHHELAQRMVERALEIWRALGDRLSQSYALSLLGDVHHHNGRLDLAEQCFQEAYQGYLAEGDERGQANSKLCIGVLQRDLGDREQALNHLDAARAGFRAIGDRYGEAQVLRFLGASHSRWDEMDTARRHFTDAIALYRDFGDRLGELRCVRHLGHVLAVKGVTAQARHILVSCRGSFAEIGDPFGEATSCWSLGELALRDGRDEEAADSFTQALTLFQGAGLVVWQGRMLRRLAEVRSTQGDQSAAVELEARAELLRTVSAPKTATVGS